jgi:hypothetical protein
MTAKDVPSAREAQASIIPSCGGPVLDGASLPPLDRRTVRTAVANATIDLEHRFAPYKLLARVYYSHLATVRRQRAGYTRAEKLLQLRQLVSADCQCVEDVEL